MKPLSFCGFAWTLELPLWSNDRDYAGQTVERYTTAELLRRLES